jgi:hypothetical protein
MKHLQQRLEERQQRRERNGKWQKQLVANQWWETVSHEERKAQAASQIEDYNSSISRPRYCL